MRAASSTLPCQAAGQTIPIELPPGCTFDLSSQKENLTDSPRTSSQKDQPWRGDVQQAAAGTWQCWTPLRQGVSVRDGSLSGGCGNQMSEPKFWPAASHRWHLKEGKWDFLVQAFDQAERDGNSTIPKFMCVYDETISNVTLYTLWQQAHLDCNGYYFILQILVQQTDGCSQVLYCTWVCLIGIHAIQQFIVHNENVSLLVKKWKGFGVF